MPWVLQEVLDLVSDLRITWMEVFRKVGELEREIKEGQRVRSFAPPDRSPERALANAEDGGRWKEEQDEEQAAARCELVGGSTCGGAMALP